MENNQLQKYKTMRYGQIAIQLRRGLITLIEAGHYWDEAEKDYMSLLKACENPSCRAIIEAGITATF